MKRYIKAASYKGMTIPKMTVSEFLNGFDFDYEVGIPMSLRNLVGNS